MDYDFKTFQFGKGAHRTREDGMCIMEATAYVAGEKHSDSPECACPVIGVFLRNWNDSLPSDAERNRLLSEYVFRLVGTKATAEIERQRSLLALDWLIRDFTPRFLDLVPSLRVHATTLRQLKQIIDMATATAAEPKVRAAGAAAGEAAGEAAGAAAGEAAGAAAWEAAGAAAWEAAWEAAGAAAWAAARPAAGAAAWAAAGAAAGESLNQSVNESQLSALRLLDRMIALSEKPKSSKPRRKGAYKVEAVPA